MSRKEDGIKISRSFVTGVVAVIFLLVGYQTALFIHGAAVTRIAAGRDAPDTVYVYAQVPSGPVETTEVHREFVRRQGKHPPVAQAVRDKLPRSKVESFRFNPNTATSEDLQRLGFSCRQAQAILNYREKGGRFRRKSDFAKSFVVPDSIYRRLEPYIDIPMVDLNLADSAALDALPGIGGWFANKILAHRKALGSFSYKEQLMDVWKFDQAKFDALKDLVAVSDEHVAPYALWTLPADSLRKHPYISNYQVARSIVLFRDNTPKEEWSVEALCKAGILPQDSADKLSRCRIAAP